MFNSEITITMCILKSKKHAKMKNKMNKTMKFLSMAALALVGAVMTGCSNDDIVDIDQPGNDNVERLTIVANLDGSTTRAINNDAVKTYAPGEKIAVVYKNTSGNTVKAESDALTESDITGGGKSAKFTVTLTNPDKNVNVTYIYPAAMAKNDGSVNYDALYNEQDGSRKKLASNFDYCTYTGAWNGVKLPAATLENQLVVCKYVIKNNEEDITSKATAMTISDGANVYTINCGNVIEGIYVAIKPIKSANIKYTVITNDGKVWTKSVSNKTYAAGDWFPLGLRMTLDTDMIPGLFSVSASKKVYFSKGNLQYDGTNWKFADSQWEALGANGTGENADVITSYPMDLFTWGNIDNPAYNGTTYVTGSADLSGTTDWGSRMGSGWRTLTGYSDGEWKYLLKTRGASTVNGTDDARYAMAKVCGVQGMIIFPDTYTHPSGVKAPVGINAGTGWNGNDYNATDWSAMEAAGCVFLPAAGKRPYTYVSGVNSYGIYWTSTADKDNGAYYMCIGSGEMSFIESSGRDVGYSVRLVRKVE